MADGLLLKGRKRFASEYPTLVSRRPTCKMILPFAGFTPASQLPVTALALWLLLL